MKIIPATTHSHFVAAAKLHKESITEGFLSKQNPGFLTALYRRLADAPGSCVYIAESDSNEVIGFVAGTLNIKRTYLHVILREGLLFSALLLPSILKFKNLRNIFETLFYAAGHDREMPAGSKGASELLSMAVALNGRGRGVGKALVSRLEQWFLEKGVAEFRVVTFSADQVSNAFYRAIGFSHYRSFKHHGNIMNEYTKSIAEALKKP